MVALDNRNICMNCKSSLCQGDIPIFQDLTDDELNTVISLIVHEIYKKGDSIFIEGDRADKLRIVHKGSIKLYRYTVDGKEQILDIVKEGDFTGELDLFNDEGKYDTNALAIDETILCTIDQKSIQSLIESNPKIGIKILSSMNKKISNLRSLVQNLATNSSELRLINLLIKLYYDNNEKERFKIGLSREDLANYTGLTRETVSRKLSFLEKEGLIELLGTKEIIIKNIEKLKEFA